MKSFITAMLMLFLMFLFAGTVQAYDGGTTEKGIVQMLEDLDPSDKGSGNLTSLLYDMAEVDIGDYMMDSPESTVWADNDIDETGVHAEKDGGYLMSCSKHNSPLSYNITLKRNLMNCRRV